ncbi:MAG: flagellar FlbD family protein [Desulfobulbus sp.]|uniref:flagellar FlbD family protein n=1 Tax=Desulfobulbus sp. TaxID=895 RepID=UPI00283AF456|nr:flagellar FlbD family protein [Desulfobulbus sp.]MDR2549654.1 flagellar FlbD family protein [Desulfobulbus sp.]
MIKLTKLNNSEFYLNPDLIKSMEETPDTIVVLINGDHIIVREKPEGIIEKIMAYRVRLLRLSRQQLDLGDAAAAVPEPPL